MAVLPSFIRSRRPRHSSPSNGNSAPDKHEGAGSHYAESNLTTAQVHRATRTRAFFAFTSSFFLFIAVIFLILVEIGDTHIRPVLNDIWFLRLDLSNVIPFSVPNSSLINSIAQTLGLHDFYTVGLWNFCEGYNGQGVTHCSKPQTLYWFNPVEILLNELLNGATIALPTQVTTYLDILKTASQFMFGLFLAGTCLATVMIFLTPLSVFSRWAAFPVAVFTFLAALLVTVASILATAIFVIVQMAFTSVTELNIGASIGKKMFAFMWIASAFTILAWLIQTSLCCCCVSRRDIKQGNKKGIRAAQRVSGTSQTIRSESHTKENASSRGFLGLRRR